MQITKASVAGTLESSDVMIQLFPGDGKVEIDLTSSVDVYYHDAILRTMEEVLAETGVDSAKIQAVDHGALDCTIRARLTTAIKRSLKEATV